MAKPKYLRRLNTLECKSEQIAPRSFGYEQWLDFRHESDSRYWDVKLALVELTGLPVEEFHRIPFLNQLNQLPNWPEIWKRYKDYVELLLERAFPNEYVPFDSEHFPLYT